MSGVCPTANSIVHRVSAEGLKRIKTNSAKQLKLVARLFAPFRQNLYF
jgi:hypothetical protein